MNTRMERLISDEKYGSEPADGRGPVDFDIDGGDGDAALELILAEFNAQARKGGAA